MSDGLGAIYPAMLNAIIALRCLGYSLDDPQVIRAMDEFEKLGIDWPNGRAGLSGADLPHAAVLLAGVGYGAGGVRAGRGGRFANGSAAAEGGRLDAVEGSSPQGRLGANVKIADPSWLVLRVTTTSFQPDVDDTGQVLLALKKVDNPRERYQYEVSQRAIEWVFAMQCKNGGWASFDKDNTKMIFQSHSVCRPQRDARSADGGHYGAHSGDAGDLWLHAAGQARGEGDQVYSTRAGAGWKLVWALGRELSVRDVPGAARLEAMESGTTSRRSSRRRSGFAWCRTPMAAGARPAGRYDDPNQRGVGPSTPSQTAWALLGLLAAGDTRRDSVAKGVRWLMERQHEDGSWDELMPGRNGEAITRAQDSRGCFIWDITCTSSTSRCWR